MRILGYNITISISKQTTRRERVKELARLLIDGDITEKLAAREIRDALNTLKPTDETNSNGKYREGRLSEIIKLDGYNCFYCNKKTYRVESFGKQEWNSSTVDHVLPKKRGGDNSIDNCVCACYSCNNSKGYQTLIPRKR
jgi:5-methylcytosine-specific restriction endonuclease McrA